MENVKTWMLLRVLNNVVAHANLQQSLTVVIMQNQIKFFVISLQWSIQFLSCFSFFLHRKLESSE